MSTFDSIDCEPDDEDAQEEELPEEVEEVDEETTDEAAEEIEDGDQDVEETALDTTDTIDPGMACGPATGVSVMTQAQVGSEHADGVNREAQKMIRAIYSVEMLPDFRLILLFKCRELEKS
jgi:hypothetical protein